jgi:hypothetical protein
MLAVPPDAIHKTIAILAIGGTAEAKVEADVATFATDKMVARRLIDWIPEAFGIVLASHIGKIHLPATFSARSSDGQWKQFEFKAEPIFVEALRIATDMYHSGDRSAFGNIAKRSSMVDVVNKALNAGDSIDGAMLSGPALIGVPAEVYEVKATPIWRRLFRSSRWPNKALERTRAR